MHKTTVITQVLSKRLGTHQTKFLTTPLKICFMYCIVLLCKVACTLQLNFNMLLQSTQIGFSIFVCEKNPLHVEEKCKLEIKEILEQCELLGKWKFHLSKNRYIGPISFKNHLDIKKFQKCDINCLAFKIIYCH